MSDTYPQFPLYIPSKGRAEYMITSKALTLMNVQHYVVVEPDQVSDYENAAQEMKLSANILPLDMTYKEKYELCDEHGLTKSTGPGPARNFAWEHSIKNGFTHHWVMDDNIASFRRLNRNQRIKVENSAFWRAMEDFCLRYKNIAMAGPCYMMFAPARTAFPPFITNTRIYSCNFIRNDLSFRWRGRYNEDTILSLDMLKAGWCTVQFYAFLQEKLGTQVVKGGNTGTIAKSQMQVKVHPDVSKLTWRYNRWHHHVDYSSFRKQKLIKNQEVVTDKKVNNYGMSVKKYVS